jgi:hypothetical protein
VLTQPVLLLVEGLPLRSVLNSESEHCCVAETLEVIGRGLVDETGCARQYPQRNNLLLDIASAGTHLTWLPEGDAGSAILARLVDVLGLLLGVLGHCKSADRKFISQRRNQILGTVGLCNS